MDISLLQRRLRYLHRKLSESSGKVELIDRVRSIPFPLVINTAKIIHIYIYISKWTNSSIKWERLAREVGQLFGYLVNLSELIRELDIVEKWSKIESIVIRGVALCMVGWSKNRRFVAIYSVRPVRMQH